MPPTTGSRFVNAYRDSNDDGKRVPSTYFARRAYTELTRNLATTEVAPAEPLDLGRLTNQRFALSWFGHSSLLVRAGLQWILVDPVFSRTVGPLPGVGPACLTPLPISPERLPRIDIVLISHDHYDHLDRATMRRLAGQPGGAPRFLVGTGLGPWFARTVGTAAVAFAWWQSETIGDAVLTFVPAQHNSGRGVVNRNSTLWGGWVVQHSDHTLYVAGDTAFIAPLFEAVRTRFPAIDLAALPIGAYRPRAMMRFEHMDPSEASDAHRILGARRSFGVHWGTLQLGDDAPFDPARNLAEAVAQRGITSFGLVAIGAVLGVTDAAKQPPTLIPPGDLKPVRAGQALNTRSR